MISPSRMRELAEEQKADYIENVHFKDKFGEFTCNVDKKGTPHCRGMYRDYFTCRRCKNASWYDDDYCNNQHIHFIDKENVKTTAVYCENYVIKE